MTHYATLEMEKAIDKFSVEQVRSEFPILTSFVHGKPLVYLDNAASSQKPQVVINAIEQYYSSENANVHRGVHHLSEVATAKYEAARAKIQKYLHASSEQEIIMLEE